MMATTDPRGGHAADKFNDSRTAEYAEQSRIALAGYDACHELTACMLAATLSERTQARVLIAGGGGPAWKSRR